MSNIGARAAAPGLRGRDGVVSFVVSDSGSGLVESAAAFVPFYTTKPKSSGIGLTLGRQIATAQGERLEYRREPDFTTFLLHVLTDI